MRYARSINGWVRVRDVDMPDAPDILWGPPTEVRIFAPFVRFEIISRDPLDLAFVVHVVCGEMSSTFPAWGTVNRVICAPPPDICHAALASWAHVDGHAHIAQFIHGGALRALRDDVSIPEGHTGAVRALLMCGTSTPDIIDSIGGSQSAIDMMRSRLRARGDLPPVESLTSTLMEMDRGQPTRALLDELVWIHPERRLSMSYLRSLRSRARLTPTPAAPPPHPARPLPSRHPAGVGTPP